MEVTLTKDDRNILNLCVLDALKSISSNNSVECVYALTMIHNYHNVYGKPVVKMVAIVNRTDGNLEEIISSINSKHELLFEIKVERVHYKDYLSKRYRMLELSASNILYDKYGTYYALKNKVREPDTKEMFNPRVVKLENTYNVR